MPMPKLPLDGSCRCGEIRLRISAPPLVTMACHCKGCQKMSASAFSCSAAIPADGFAVTAGEPVIGGTHGDNVHHYHCPRCQIHRRTVAVWSASHPVAAGTADP